MRTKEKKKSSRKTKKDTNDDLQSVLTLWPAAGMRA